MSAAVTFLFTDLEGSTRRWEADPGAMRAALARHDALSEGVVAEAGGRVFKHTGDGICAVFESAADGATAVAELNRALAAEDWGQLGELRVRSGLHTGEAEERDGDYFGSTVNRTARLMDSAHGGQVVLSEAAAALARPGLDDGLRLDDLGQHRFKDLADPEHVYQLRGPGLLEDFLPLRSLESYPNNLPSHLTSFVGRRSEMEEVAQLLEESRLVTLTGVGGVGKTRLAIQVAAENIERFPDGVWFVELAPLTDGALVARQVADDLGIQEDPTRPIDDLIVEHLATRTMLIVLDNCEHVIEESAAFAEMVLGAAPGLRMIVTSREGLAVGGERLWRVPSMSGDLTEDAVELFIQRARLVRPDLEIDDEERAAIEQICRRLDGMPLAIELATARLNVFSPQQVAERLDDRFRLLTGGSRTAMPRQRTLQATMDWSYDLLGDQERILLRRLSAFYGGFTFEAAEDVATDEIVDRYEVLDLLSHLVETSMVAVDAGVETRYRLLETVRQYAQDKLVESGEADIVRRRHALWAASVADGVHEALLSATGEEAAGRLEADHDNFRAAMTWSMEAGEGDLALRIASGLGRFWFYRSYMDEGRDWLHRALAAASDEPTFDRAEAMGWEGSFALHGGDLLPARKLAEDALAVAEEVGSDELIARSRVSVGNIYLVRGALAEARQQFDTAVEWARRESSAYLSVPLVNLAILEAWAGNAQRSMERIDELLELAGSEANAELRGWALVAQSEMHNYQGDHEEAAAVGKEALARVRTAGQKTVEVWCLSGLALSAIQGGQLALAREYLREGAALARELGRGSQESSIFQGFAMLAQAEGDTAGAVQQWVRWSQSEETLLGERGLGLLSAEVAAALADSDPATAATMLAISDYRLARSGAILLPLTAEAIETIRAGLDPAPEAAETPHHEVTAMLQELALRPD